LTAKTALKRVWATFVESVKLRVRVVQRMGEDRGVHRVLVGKPEGKRPLGRPRHR